MADVENKQTILRIEESQRTSFDFESIGGKNPDLSKFAVRQAVGDSLREIAAADPTEQSMAVDYDKIRELADDDEANSHAIL